MSRRSRTEDLREEIAERKIETNGDTRMKVDKKWRRGQSGAETTKTEDKIKIEDDHSTGTPTEAANIPRRDSSTPLPPAVKPDAEEVIGGDITLKLEPGKPPKLARSSSKKIPTRPPPLFLDHEDVTSEARRTFEVLPDCNYANKYLGTTDAAYECDCNEVWGKKYIYGFHAEKHAYNHF